MWYRQKATGGRRKTESERLRIRNEDEGRRRRRTGPV
jgi:hypothetical protein